MKHSEALKKIDAAYWRLERCCESTTEWDRYIQLIQEGERGHRRFKPEGLQCGLTVAQAVRLFAVKQVFERFVPAHSAERIFTPEAKDFFSIRADVFAACAIADLCRAKIRNEFADHEMLEWLASINYAELNKDRRVAA